MKKHFQAYLFVVMATTILLALLKLAGSPATTWFWVAFPIFGSAIIWLLFIGGVTTVGLIWPTPKPAVPDYFKPGYNPDRHFVEDKHKVETLRVARDLIPLDQGKLTPHKEQYYRKAVALELATLAHDTPGVITWKIRDNHIVGELKILVKNEPS